MKRQEIMKLAAVDFEALEIAARTSVVDRKSGLKRYKHRSVVRCKKVRYHDHEEAVDALRTIRTYRSYAADEVNPARLERRVYSCGICKGWHLTSQSLIGLESKTEIKKVTSFGKEYANVA